ncbi:hypothetical protein [Bacteroides sp.]|uniref:tetratricopeptide repeat protein n=1 Tax=Bacteroides sp. TaxID=29523 RepID=UPI00258EC848|nr:hypothetical protein [Bacteroides sp.]
MKITKLLAVVLLLLGVTSVSAQVDEKCLSNSSISHEAVKVGNYKDAYEPWKEVIKDCPLLRYYTFTDGFKILTSFLDKAEKSSADYTKYFDELMQLHDSRMEYIPQFNEKGVTNIPSVDAALGLKVIDYLTYSTNPDYNLAYDWTKKSVLAEKADSQPAVLFYLVNLSLAKLQTDATFKESFVNDYLFASQLAEEAIETSTKDVYKKAYEDTKNSLTALFINSGAADCQSLQDIYAPKVEENKDNIEYLKQVISVMESLKCRDQEAYAQASFYSYQIEPTAEAAMGCAMRSYKKGDINETIKFIDEAMGLEVEPAKKAEKAYYAATFLFAGKRYSQARSYALKALGFDPNNGSAYILIAKLYASSPNWSDEAVLNKCTYFLVIDKLQRAKAVDSSVANEANELIRVYSQYTPTAQDLFMLGYKAGDSITIGGWIGESTTIR